MSDWIECIFFLFISYIVVREGRCFVQLVNIRLKCARFLGQFSTSRLSVFTVLPLRFLPLLGWPLSRLDQSSTRHTLYAPRMLETRKIEEMKKRE